jgi:pimeloyl-ACP methyl ester carboxylesterase
LVKSSGGARGADIQVRLRRAYFDCRFGQLHVRTAFPTSGGFNEATTLVCVHELSASSRQFVPLLPQVARDRSVYAPDLPGCGESDAPTTAPTPIEHAAAIEDFAADLRLRQIDVLGVGQGAAVVANLAIGKPDLVRSLALIDADFCQGTQHLAQIQQPVLVLFSAGAEAAASKYKPLLRHARSQVLPQAWPAVLTQAPESLGATLCDFLK